MAQYEYKVVPAPRKGRKAKGHKTNEERFSFALQEVMNSLGADGWDYLRAETLPSDERAGLTGSQTVYRDVLVFRRERTAAQDPVNLPAIDHLPEASPVPPPLARPHRLVGDTEVAEAPYPAPPVHDAPLRFGSVRDGAEKDSAEASEDEDSDSGAAVPPRSA